MAVLSKFDRVVQFPYDETDKNLSPVAKIYTAYHAPWTIDLRGDMAFFTDPYKLTHSISKDLLDMRCVSLPKRVYAKALLGLKEFNSQISQLVPLILSEYGQTIKYPEHIFIECGNYKISPYAYVEDRNYVIDLLVDRLNDIQKKKANYQYKPSTMDKILIYGKETGIDENTPKDSFTEEALNSLYYQRNSFIFINFTNAQYLFSSINYFVQQLRDFNEITTTMKVTYHLPLDTAILVISSFL